MRNKFLLDATFTIGTKRQSTLHVDVFQYSLVDHDIFKCNKAYSKKGVKANSKIFIVGILLVLIFDLAGHYFEVLHILKWAAFLLIPSALSNIYPAPTLFAHSHIL